MAYLIVLRVETYMMDVTAGATDLYIMEGVPPGTAYWQTTNLAGSANPTENVTDTNAPSHLALDADEFLIFAGAQRINLIGNWTAAPVDGNDRAVRTLVYAYECSAAIIEIIAGQSAVISTNPH